MAMRDVADPVPTNALELMAQALQQQNQIIQNQNDMLAAMRAGQPIREIGFSDPEYQQRMRAEMRSFKTPTFQNTFEANPDGLTDETIDRVSKLRAGRYLNGVVVVEIGAKGQVVFRYKNKSADQRMNLPFRSFPDLVDQIWAEMHAA